MLTSIPTINEAKKAEEYDKLWLGCQMFVVGAGNVSKLLWGAGPQRAQIAATRVDLRASLQVEDDSPLYSLDLRNHFEHFDERIDRWWRENQSPDGEQPNYVDRAIGPSGAFPVGRTEEFRVYDPSGPSIFFWGERYDLQPIASECVKIFDLGVAALRIPGASDAAS